jgi:hypothetical protein
MDFLSNKSVPAILQMVKFCFCFQIIKRS